MAKRQAIISLLVKNHVSPGSMRQGANQSLSLITCLTLQERVGCWLEVGHRSSEVREVGEVKVEVVVEVEVEVTLRLLTRKISRRMPKEAWRHPGRAARYRD
jgi:hypothetical protein